jgi:S-adenosylmethionine hydrolase
MVTFTSDFGLSDPYVGEVKGVVSSFTPEVRIIDLTHLIEPGNLIAASFVLAESFRYFPERTLHLVVVDPGVGTDRAIVFARTNHYCFVGPDNGVLWEALHRDGLTELYALDSERLYRSWSKRSSDNPVIGRIVSSDASATFHGRDLFAPLVAHVCAGHPVGEVTDRMDGRDIVKLAIPAPVQSDDSVTGRVLYIDHFGNLVTNIPRSLLGRPGEVFIRMRNELVLVGKLMNTYAEVEPGKPLALIGSRNCLEIAVNRGSARDHFGSRAGNEILVMKGKGYQ